MFFLSFFRFNAASLSLAAVAAAAAAYIFSDKKNNRLFVLFQLKMSMRKEHPPERRFVSIKLEDFDEGETFQTWKGWFFIGPNNLDLFSFIFCLAFVMGVMGKIIW